MSTRLGDASGRRFTDYTAQTIRNEKIAIDAGLEPWDGYSYRRYLLGDLSGVRETQLCVHGSPAGGAPVITAPAPREGWSLRRVWNYLFS